MTDFRIVPDVMREREPLIKGKAPVSDLSKALLRGSTVFIPGAIKTWGSLYALAKNHGKYAKTKRVLINNEEGTLVWFVDEK